MTVASPGMGISHIPHASISFLLATIKKYSQLEIQSNNLSKIAYLAKNSFNDFRSFVWIYDDSCKIILVKSLRGGSIVWFLARNLALTSDVIMSMSTPIDSLSEIRTLQFPWQTIGRTHMEFQLHQHNL